METDYTPEDSFLDNSEIRSEEPLGRNIFPDDYEKNIIVGMLANDYSSYAQAAAVYYFRRIFSSEHKMLSQQPEHYTELVTRLLSIVSSPTHIPDVRLNAAWAVTNMSCLSKEVNHMIVEQGGIEALLSGLITGSGEFRLQCIWALGNIAADCTPCKIKCRETSLLVVSLLLVVFYVFYYKRKYLQQLTQLLSKGVYKRSDDLTNIVCCVQNLVRGGIQTIPFKFVRSLVSSLTLIIRQHRSITALVRKCIWAIAALADDMHAGIQVDR
uniref:Importin subunit alpha n=1 Tax=Heterorhabditis bacteriophora TaxID=37862 RepID=A0A1I7XDI1_HETBA